MTREEREKLAAQLLSDDNSENADLSQKLDVLAAKINQIVPVMELLASFFVMQQKDFCEARGISPDALRTKIMNGDIEFLQADGSRLNYIPLKASETLKPRKRRS